MCGSACVWVRACDAYVWCVRVVFACGACVRCVRVVWACGVCMWCLHVVCACGVGVWCGSVVRECGVCVWCGSVTTIYNTKWLKNQQTSWYFEAGCKGQQYQHERRFHLKVMTKSYQLQRFAANAFSVFSVMIVTKMRGRERSWRQLTRKLTFSLTNTSCIDKFTNKMLSSRVDAS